MGDQRRKSFVMQIAVSTIGCMLSNGHLYVKVVIDMNCHCSEWKLVVGMKYIDFAIIL